MFENYTNISEDIVIFLGELTAHCVGPHKVAYCELYDHGDGTFTLNVKPQEAGRHALTIKYGGEYHPFNLQFMYTSLNLLYAYSCM